MKRIGQVAGGIAAALAGLGAGILLHPRSGARNRQVAADVARRQSANVATMVGASMAPARARGRGEARLAAEVGERLSQTFGAAAAEVRVTTHRQTVTLRGEVSRLDDIDAFEEAARSVPGVDDVNNLLRLPLAARQGSAATPPASPAR